MPSLSDTLITRATQPTNILDSVTKGMGRAVELAKTAEDIQRGREQTKMAREQLEMNKANTLNEALTSISTEPSPRARKIKMKIANNISVQLGKGEIPELTQELMTGEDPNARNAYLKMMSTTDVGKAFSDPNLRDAYFGSIYDDKGAAGAWDTYNKEIGRKLEQQKLDAATEKTARRGGQMDAKQVADLRKERSKDVTTDLTRKVQYAYGKIEEAVKSDTPAGDMAMLYNMIKMWDPPTGVKEGEMLAAEKVGRNVPAIFVSAYNKAVSGRKLTSAQRKDFYSQAQDFMLDQVRQQELADQEYEGIARDNALNPSHLGIRANDKLAYWEKRFGRTPQERQETQGEPGSMSAQAAPGALPPPPAAAPQISTTEGIKAALASGKYTPEKIAQMYQSRGIQLSDEDLQLLGISPVPSVTPPTATARGR